MTSVGFGTNTKSLMGGLSRNPTGRYASPARFTNEAAEGKLFAYAGKGSSSALQKISSMLFPHLRLISDQVLFPRARSLVGFLL